MEEENAKKVVEGKTRRPNQVGDPDLWELVAVTNYDRPNRTVVTEALQLPNKNTHEGCLIKTTTVTPEGVSVSMQYIHGIRAIDRNNNEGEVDGMGFISARNSTVRR